MKWIQNLKDLLTKSSTDENELLKTVLKQLSDEEAQKIQDKLGIKVKGYNRVVDNYAIKHILKNHGDAKTEAQRGQVAVKLSDFEKIMEIVNAPDQVIHAGKNTTGRTTIKYQKNISEIIYTYLEEVRTKRKKLATNTMYKHKKPPK